MEIPGTVYLLSLCSLECWNYVDCPQVTPRALPVSDNKCMNPIPFTNQYVTLGDKFYVKTRPAPVAAPVLIKCALTPFLLSSVQEYDIDAVVSEVMERLQELEAEQVAEQVAEQPHELPDNVILFKQKRRSEW
jgi:hypothetical protein